MIKAMVFDVDDTLYDLSVPFRRTAEEVFPGEKLDLYGTFLASRKYGDQVYAQSFRGEMSLRDMYIYRYQNAFADFGKKIDAETALKFQAVYERKQQEICMTEGMERMLECLGKKVKLGIITNGPAQHQWDKVHALGAERWIPMEHILISGEEGVAKPDKEIFERAEKRLGLRPDELCYVGDSYGNDILGAKRAGWKAVWYNHRGHQAGKEVTPDAVVDTETELAELLGRMADGG